MKNRKISSVTMNYKQITYNQSGFSPIFIVGLLAAGIIAGTILVQNGVNFLPKAAEQEGLNPSEGKTKSCNDNDQACKTGNDKICAADTVTYCDNRSGTPRAIRKSGGYWDPKDPNTDPKSGCVFDYREVSNKNSECAKPESKSGDVVFTTKEEAKKLDQERERTSSTPDKSTTACSPEATKTYYDAKVANNLARFYAIRNGAGGLCVPNDLGVPYKEDFTVKKDRGEEIKGRLMLCSSSKDNPPKLYWMIASYNDNSLIPVPENQKTPPDAKSPESEFKNLQEARCVAGVDSGDKCKGV